MAGILTACVLAASLVGVANASAASTGFYVHNLTSTPLKVTAVKWDGGPERGETAPEPPKVGDLLPPGASPLHIEIQYRDAGGFNEVITSSVELTFRRVGPDEDQGAITLKLFDNDPSHPGFHGNRTAECAVPAVLRCERNVQGERDQVRFLEAPGTTRTAAGPKEQADVLRTLCTRKNIDTDVVKCGFGPTASETYGPLHVVGTPFANCTSGQQTGMVKFSERVGVTDNLGIERGPSTEPIFERAEAGAKYIDPDFRWKDEHTFKGEESVSIPAGFVGWLLAGYPLLRHTGDFRLHIGNTTWVLPDVYFETPDPGRPLGFDAEAAQMTPEQRAELCKGGGLVRAPVRYAQESTRGHWIYNLSGETFRLAEIRGLSPDKPPIFDSGPTAPPPPKVGDTLAPGDKFHVELVDTGSNGARLLWRREGSNTADTDLSILITDSDQPKCNTSSPFACATAPELIGVFDRKGTERTIGPGSPHDQAEVLRAFCRKNSVVPFPFVDGGFARNTCDYGFDSRDKTVLGAPEPALPIVNCGAPTKAIANWWVTDKVGYTTSTGIESLPGTDLDFILGKVRAGIPPGADFDDVTFKDRFTGLVGLSDATYVTGRPPLVRDTGNFTVRVGNTTWSLKGLTLDTPNPDGHLSFSVHHRDLTEAEQGECNGDPAGDGAP